MTTTNGQQPAKPSMKDVMRPLLTKKLAGLAADDPLRPLIEQQLGLTPDISGAGSTPHVLAEIQRLKESADVVAKSAAALDAAKACAAEVIGLKASVGQLQASIAALDAVINRTPQMTADIVREAMKTLPGLISDEVRRALA